MAFVSVQDLQEGMVLACDLFTEKGQFVLGKGAVLSRTHLSALAKWGIAEADIEGGDENVGEAALPTIDPQILERSEGFIAERFRLNPLDKEVTAEAFRVAVELTAQRMQRGWQPQNGELDEKWDIPVEVGGKPSSDELVRSKVKLASLPVVYTKIVDALNTPGCSAAHLADIVSKDSSISLRLLRLVNSSYYSLPTKVDSISRAIALLGTRELMTLAIGISIVRLFRNVPSQLIDMESFWRHAIRCALYSQALAKRKAGLAEEQFFVGGLLHDIGRLVMLVEIPEYYAKAMLVSQREAIPLYQAERQELVYDHCLIGRKLCELWRLSRTQAQMIGWHHKPQGDSYSLETCIVHVADFFAQAFGEETNLMRFVPPLQDKAWETLDLPVGMIPTLSRQVESLFNEIVKTFLDDDISA